MKNKLSAIISIIALSTTLGFSAYAACQSRDGKDACDYITVSKRSGCVVLINSHSSKRIKVKRTRGIPGYVFTVYPQSEEIPTDLDGNCFESMSKDITVWYDD